MTTPDLSNSSPNNPAAALEVRVSAEKAGIRFDHFLMQYFAGSSRSILIQSIRLGLILVDGKKKKSSYRLKTDEFVSGKVYLATAPKIIAQKIPFEVIFEDNDLIIISKPPGIVVHPGAGNPDSTLVNGLLHHCQKIADVGDEMRPGIVHRLDKDTSGIMVVAKTATCHRLLVDAFKDRTVDKEYTALVFGFLEPKHGRIVAPISRHPKHRKKMTVCDEGKGRYATSTWQVLEEYPEGCSLLRVKIETGRTHQIRVHLSSLGHPVSGDMLYGRARNTRQYPRQMLHAHTLSFIHPINGERLAFSAPVWQDFQRIIDQLHLQDYKKIVDFT